MSGEWTRRLPLLKYDELNDDQRKVWDEVVANRPSFVVAPEGHLYGPFNIWMYSPTVGLDLTKLGGDLRYHTSVDYQLNEIACCTVTTYWRAHLPSQGHAGLAKGAGVADHVVDAISRGERPEFENEQQAIVYDMASTLVRTGDIDDQLYERAREHFNYQEIMELVVICGWYSLVSFAATALGLGESPGMEPIFEGRGGRLGADAGA